MLYNQLQFNDSSRFIKDIPKRVLENDSPQTAFPDNGRFGRTAQPSWSQNSRFRTPSSSGQVLWKKGDGAPDFTHQGISVMRADSLNTKGTSLKSFRSADPVPTCDSVGTAQTAFANGDHVRHRKFGKGVILRISGENGDLRALVRFDDPQYGTKQLSLALSPMIRLEE